MYNPKWTIAAHTALLDEAFVYLDMRKAPVWWIRKHHIDTTKPLPADLDDDEWVPFTRLLIQEPPRHGKSEHTSRFFSSWYLGRHPSHHVMLTSYGDNYAATWGRKARDVMETVGERAFGLKVSKRTSAANDWEIEGHVGGMNTAGVGGAITGRGANCFINDDAVKDSKEAASPVIQESTWDWWRSTASTRLEVDEDGLEPIAVMIGTRWNEADLIGRVIAGEEDVEDDEIWFVLRLPAIAEQNDPLGRQPGEALWPERRSLKFLERIKGRIGSYWWSALYQQRPTPEEGNIFKRAWWQFYDSLPAGSISGYTILDTAHDEKTTSDYSVLATVMRVGKDLYWKDVKRGRWEFPELLQKARDARTEHGLPLLIEQTPGSLPLIQTLEREIAGVIPFKTGTNSKLSRAASASPYAEGGNFYLPRNAKWVNDFIEEHAAFPNGAHDDQVDTTSMAVLRLLGAPPLPTRTQVQRPRVAQRVNGWRSV